MSSESYQITIRCQTLNEAEDIAQEVVSRLDRLGYEYTASILRSHKTKAVLDPVGSFDLYLDDRKVMN